MNKKEKRSGVDQTSRLEIKGSDYDSNTHVLESSQRNDVSKSLQEFRNLEYSFMMDNGYLLFDMTDKRSETKIDPCMVLIHINTSLKTNISSLFSELSEIPLHKIKEICSIEDEAKTDWFSRVMEKYEIIVGVSTSDTCLRFVPGYHHICNRSNDTIPTKCDSYRYQMVIKEDQIVYFHPYVFFDMSTNRDNDSNLQNLKWYGVERSDTHQSDHLWGSWDLFKTNGDFTIIDDVKDHELFRSDQDLYKGFIELEQKGYGEFVKMNQDNILFRIRPRCCDKSSFIQLGDPSIYESVIEIVYYFDMTERISHTNYTEVDRFEVRTGGVLARSCNSKFAQKLYDMCTQDSITFKIDLTQIIEYFRTIDYNDLLCEWYPAEIKTEDSQDDTTPPDAPVDTDVLVLGVKPSQFDLDMKLNIKKVYSINVYKFDRLDHKNISRIRMITSWMNDLKLRGGFVLTDETESKVHNKGDLKNISGYMIVGGEEVVVTHRDKLGDLAVFQNRFKCLHWKKVKHYHYSNHDHISRLRYEKFPEQVFILTHAEIDKNPEHAEILSVVRNI